ncbi:MAG TPA: T9SS type A sorting domain-containing protein, partial [Aequorivita sp.]|nr:T9SS type A sorting domain-containing protein [Aequorivita sp.]
FSVYPNPASNGYVNISSKISGEKNVSIFDVLGKEIIKTKMLGETLNISALSRGIYILKVEQGKTSTTVKLVVK